MQFTTAPAKPKTAKIACLAAIILIFSLSLAPPPAAAEDTDSIKTLRQMGKAFADIAEKTSPAVVGVEVERTIAQDFSSDWGPFGGPMDPFDDDFFDFFFRRRAPRQRRAPQPKTRQVAQGSGFIISPNGYILTNNHLAEEAEKITVKLADGRSLQAKTIGTDPDSDVAVIKIDANDLPTLELADSDELEVGEWVIAIGNPFGLTHTVTAGIVSDKGRSVGLTTYEDFIQTDAAINPGNSGGPLLNLDGKAVGMNTAIIGSRGNIGIGLAIPINMAKAVYDDLVEGGTVVRGYLGVLPQDITPEMAKSLGMKDIKGVILPEVTPDSAADKAGLKQGDIVIEFNGEPVENEHEFRNRVAMLKPGTEVEVVVLRDGKKKTLSVELGERPKQGRIASAPSETLDKLGITVENLSDELAQRLGYEGMTGVVVTAVQPGSLAANAGIRSGTLIQEINRQPVKNTKDFDEAIEKAADSDAILLLINNGRFSQFVVLQLPKE